MKPIIFSEILNDLPDEFIDSAAEPHYGKNSVPGACSTEFFPNTESTVFPFRMKKSRSAELQKESSGDVSVPHWITAVAMAACLLFAVGFGAAVMYCNQDDMTTQSADDESRLEELTEETGTGITYTDYEGDNLTTARTSRTEKQNTETTGTSSSRQTETRTETVQNSTTATTAAETARRHESSDTTQAETAAVRSETTTARPVTETTAAGTSAAVTSRTTTVPASTTTVSVTTTTTRAPLPDIVRQYCRTLVGEQPLWADYREISYHDGKDYTIIVNQDEYGNFIRIPNDKPFELTGMYLEVGCAQGAPGETVTVPVYIAGGDWYSANMFVDSPAELELTEIISNIESEFGLVPWGSDMQTAHDRSPDCLITAALSSGGYGCITMNENNIPFRDGHVAAYYSYTIPEDAQPGTVYPVCVNTAKTEFTAYHAYETDEPEPITGRESSVSYKDYQYTLLNGVIVVE